MAASGNLQPGQLIQDTYRIVRRIGEGGMGEVYEATHARLAGRYAIKLLLREVGSDPSLIARFQREAQVTSSLRHPNIVQVLDFRQLPDGTPYFVMEYLEGTDLAAEIERGGPLSLARAADVIEQIAAGLSAAHEQGIVHRDLKPANLFLVVLPGTGKELVKIVDFGISKVRTAGTQLTRTSVVMGTPQYMAPEQAQGQADQIDARSDQFALATIAYEMIAGRCAFPGDTIPSVMYQLVHVDPAPLAVNGQPVAAAIDAVVRRGLAKRSGDRFPSVLDFARALQRAVADAAHGVSAIALSRTEMASAPTLAPPSGSSLAAAASGVSVTPAPETTLGRAAAEAAGRPAGTPLPRGVRRTLAIGGGVAVVGGAVLALAFRTGGPPAPPPVGGAAARVAAPPPAVVAALPAGRPAPGEMVTVEVEDAPRDLVVSIDGAEPHPLPARLPKGPDMHQLVFQAPGYRSRTMQLDGSKDRALVLSLKRGSDSVARGDAPAWPPPSASAKPSQKADRKQPGKFRRTVDDAAAFAKRHFGTGAE